MSSLCVVFSESMHSKAGTVTDYKIFLFIISQTLRVWKIHLADDFYQIGVETQ